MFAVWRRVFRRTPGLVNPESFTFIESALILAIVVWAVWGHRWVILAAILITCGT